MCRPKLVLALAQLRCSSLTRLIQKYTLDLGCGFRSWSWSWGKSSQDVLTVCRMRVPDILGRAWGGKGGAWGAGDFKRRGTDGDPADLFAGMGRAGVPEVWCAGR
jgi:hypothetical protein